MKKIYGIFRGFPGLGRVSAGIALLKQLQNKGCEVAAISYHQGTEALSRQGIPRLFEYDIEPSDITSIGINPITGFATRIIDKILEDEPDMVIIDGEPLLQSTLCDVYSKEKIISLLNPTDLHNESLPKSTMCFYHKNYLSAANAIVHGIGVEDKIVVKNECSIHYVSTILRQEIIEFSKDESIVGRIVGILGGGTVNSSKMFLSSTVEMGRKIVSIARKMTQYSFEIYCNDKKIKTEIEKNQMLPSNVCIVDSYTSPSEMYKGAKMVIARAGRNVVSELLYLNIPGLLIATNGDYRSKEQEKNIESMIVESNYLFDRINVFDDDDVLMHKIVSMMDRMPKEGHFVPGNSAALEIIEKVIGRI